MEFCQISASLAFDQRGSHPGIQHNQFHLQVVSNVWSPFLTIRVEFLNFSLEEQFLPNIEQSFLVVCIQSVIGHAFDPHNSSFVKNPVQKILNDLFIAKF